MSRANLLLPLIFAVVCICKCYAESNDGKIWVVLVAGSNTYGNYRHQSDVYHAYQIVKARGIPDENIIVMHYDDIASNRRNPKKGEVFNKPGGPNVYKNIPKDYVGSAVTPENFLSVLSGDADKMKNVGSGKVVKSTDKDNIFVFYSDHGGPGIIAFVEEVLYASDLLSTLKQMSTDKKYNKLALFIEACYSGSMFENLLANNTGVYAMTAANSKESSYARYYDSKIKAYLGDEYSTKLLELLDDGLNSAISELYTKLKAAVEGSHVEQYGDLSVSQKSVSAFIGGPSVQSKPLHHRHFVHHKTHQRGDAIPTLAVPIALIEKEIDSTDDIKEKEKLQKHMKHLLKNRAAADRILDNILTDACENDEERYSALKKMDFAITLDNMYCAKAVTKAFHENCFGIPSNPYVVSLIGDLVKLCNVDWSNEERAVEVIQNVCEEFEDKPVRVM